MRLPVVLLGVLGHVVHAEKTTTLGGNNGQPRVMSIGLVKHTQQSQNWKDLSRVLTIEQALGHNRTAQAYFTTLEIGTPPQSIDLLVDTGSAELWLLDAAANICSSPGTCSDPFNPSRSSSLQVVAKGGFEVVYINNDKATGDQVQDVLHIGGDGNQAIIIDDLQFGLVKETTVDTGILGLGYSSNESGHPSILDKLKSAGHIAARAYSLYLDDYSSDTGSLLLGGIDRSSFIGTIQTIDVIPIQPGNYGHFLVGLDSIVANFSASSSGTSQGLYESQVASSSPSLCVALDSGTTISYLPLTLVQNIWTYFGVFNDTANSGVGLVDCTLATRSAGLTIDFQFTNTGSVGIQGPVIKVPFREFILDNVKGSSSGGDINLPPNLGFEQACAFGLLGSSSSSLPILGQNFLRSAYVVHDLYHHKIGLAQANLNVSSGVISISGDGGGSIVEITEEEGIPTSMKGVAFQGGPLDGAVTAGNGEAGTTPTSAGGGVTGATDQSGAPTTKRSDLLLISSWIVVLLTTASVWRIEFS